MRPVEATATSPAPCPRTSATFSAVACVSWKPLGPVQALAPPELRTTAETWPPFSTCSDQSTGAAFTRLEVKTPAAAQAGPVVDHEGQVRVAVLLDSGGDARRRESLGCRDAHGATPIVERPVASASPRAMFMLWTAPPAVPLVRLSMALIAMMRCAAASYATCT